MSRKFTVDPEGLRDRAQMIDVAAESARTLPPAPVSDAGKPSLTEAIRAMQYEAAESVRGLLQEAAQLRDGLKVTAEMYEAAETLSAKTSEQLEAMVPQG